MAQSPDDMRASERIEEIASILAEAILRLKSKKMRKSSRLRDISLDSIANQSVHVVTHNKEKQHE